MKSKLWRNLTSIRGTVRYGRNVGIIRPWILKAIITKLRELIGKVDNLQEHMSNVNREMEILRI